MDNPAASVDSTQPTLTSGEGAHQKMQTIDGSQQQQQQAVARQTSKSGKKQSGSIISEPVLDDDELKPLIYGYLHKLGRNGHWQRRFFETNGERLTYYKSVKRTKVLATLDLCKVRHSICSATLYKSSVLVTLLLTVSIISTSQFYNRLVKL